MAVGAENLASNPYQYPPNEALEVLLAGKKPPVPARGTAWGGAEWATTHYRGLPTDEVERYLEYDAMHGQLGLESFKVLLEHRKAAEAERAAGRASALEQENRQS